MKPQKILSFFIASLMSINLFSQSYQDLWKEVAQAEEKSLPKTVVAATDKICQKALKEKNSPQLLKAYLYKEQYQQELTPDTIYATLPYLEEWVQKEANPLDKAILHSVLATYYNDYFQGNSYQITQRTNLAANAQGDMREWTKLQFWQKITEHTKASLLPAETLLQASTKDYEPLTTIHAGSDLFRHDFYHLLTDRALDLYREFINDNLQTVAAEAVQLLVNTHEQRIARYRSQASSRPAYIMCFLDYWEWRQETEDADTGELDALITECGQDPVCAEAYIKKAEHLQGRQQYEQALATCAEGIKRYPGYKRTAQLKNIQADITRPYLNAHLPGILYPQKDAVLTVTHKQVTGLTAKIYATSLTQAPENNESKHLSQKGELVGQQHFDLLPTIGTEALPGDAPYIFSDTLLKLAAPATNGVYILSLQTDGGQAKTIEHFFIVSRLKVMSLATGNGQTELRVVDAEGGQPLKGATVGIYQRKQQYKNLVQSMTTDHEGKVVVTQPSNRSSYLYYAYTEGDKALPYQGLYLREPVKDPVPKTVEHLTLLTDRSVYRPGQTIYVKGIAFSSLGANADIREGAEMTIRLLDANRQEVSSQKVRTNDYGSFATEFVLPLSCLNGNFTLQDDKGRGNTLIKVEEYKRPTFEITLDKPATPYRLGQTIAVTGKVEAFNGAQVQHMPVAYRVERADRLIWWRARHKSLKADTLYLDGEGRFSIPLELALAEKENGLRTAQYVVEVSVANEAGETQTASLVVPAEKRAYMLGGLTGLPATIDKGQTLSVTQSVTNAVGVPQDVVVRYRMYKKVEKGTYEKLQPILTGTFKSNKPAAWEELRRLPSGSYHIVTDLPIEDSIGDKYARSKYEEDVYLFDWADKRPGDFNTLFVHGSEGDYTRTSPAKVLLGSSCHDAYVYADIYSKGRRIASRIVRFSDANMVIELPYAPDELGILLRIVREGNETSQTLKWKEARAQNAAVKLKWGTFRDKLQPGDKETWRLVVKDEKDQPAAAELLALMYDASLDKIFKRDQGIPQTWYRQSYPDLSHSFGPHPQNKHYGFQFPHKYLQVPGYQYDELFRPEVYAGHRIFWGRGPLRMGRVSGTVMMASKKVAMNSDMAVMEEMEDMEMAAAAPESFSADASTRTAETEEEMLEENGAVRTDFAETAFFLPQLRTNEKGEVVIEFTVPQALTTWNVVAMAHTRKMVSGRLEASTITQKEFMVMPNMPRFVRKGDKAQIAAVLQNLGTQAVAGKAEMVVFDPTTEKVLYRQVQDFRADKGANAAVTFDYNVPEEYDLLGIRIVADGGQFSDGEQHLLPVLSSKQWVTETLAMPIRGNQTRTFDAERLFNHHHAGATRQKLTIEFTGNPAWYAVQALPTMNRPTSDNAIAWANAYYANTIAGHIADTHPRIKSIIKQWQSMENGKETFLSQLEKNAELKEILLEESPWVLEADTETEQRERLSMLFDANRMQSLTTSSLSKLQQLQLSDGGWSWFKGMHSSLCITQYVARLLIRLPMLTGHALNDQEKTLLQQAFGFLHKAALKEYQELLKMERRGFKVKHLSYSAMQYLYLLALSGEKVPAQNVAAYNYFMARVPNNLKDGDMPRKAESAIILQKAGKQKQSDEFIASLEEHLTYEDEVGAHFAFHEMPYRWGMKAIPAQVSVMEAFMMHGEMDKVIEEMKLWLLKQKQTQAWNSSVDNADAVYALLCMGGDWLQNRGAVTITIADRTLRTMPTADQDTPVVPALGYVKEAYTDRQVIDAPSISVSKTDDGVAWGAAYAQYFAPIADLQQQGAELNLERKMYIERVSPKGEKTLEEITSGAQLKVGDMLVSRLVLRTDRDMDFVQLKDRAAACLEPVSSLSGYCWGEAMGYYREIEDACTNYFIDRLNKGTFVFENRYRVARAGTYVAGIASVQCAYAPEYASHTGGEVLIVR